MLDQAVHKPKKPNKDLVGPGGGIPVERCIDALEDKPRLCIVL